MDIRSPLFIVSAVSVLASALIGHAQPDTTKNMTPAQGAERSYISSIDSNSARKVQPMQVLGSTSGSPIVVRPTDQTGRIEGDGWRTVDPQPVNFARQMSKLDGNKQHSKPTHSSRHVRVYKTTVSKHESAKEAIPVKAVVHEGQVRANHQSSQRQPKKAVVTQKTVTKRIAQPSRQQHLDVNLYWLSRAVEAEAGAESHAVKLAVADVILNRVHSTSYPNSVKTVIFQRSNGIYAFTSVENGWIYHQPSPASIAAAKQALYGHKNIVPSALVFYNNAHTAPTNWVKSRPVITTLGAMTFAR